MWTSFLLIQPLYLQQHTYKDPSQDLVPNNLTIRYFRFLGTIPHIHENMMLPKSDVFLTLRNDGPSMDERDNHWSMAMHGDGSKHVMIQEKATDEDFRTLRPPY